MDTAEHIHILQLTYAAQLADAVVQYGRAGILDRVRDERRAQRLSAGAAQAAKLGVSGPAEAFTVPAELFGCADWSVESEGKDGSLTAIAKRCLLCAMVKKSGGPSPCRLFCLDPIEAMVQELRPGATLHVQETLYDGERCRVRVAS